MPIHSSHRSGLCCRRKVLPASEAGNAGAATNVEASIVNGVTLYQITENGFALQATLQGTEYYNGDNLNND